MIRPRNIEWKIAVCRMLRQGLGVDDIAVRLKCSPGSVRHEVAILRHDGRLAAVLSLPKEGTKA